jgi:hypothetical protein
MTTMKDKARRGCTIGVVAVGLCVVPLRSSFATTMVSCPRIEETYISSSTPASNATGGRGYIVIANDGIAQRHGLVQFSVPSLGGRESVDSVTMGIGTLQPLGGP